MRRHNSIHLQGVERYELPGEVRCFEKGALLLELKGKRHERVSSLLHEVWHLRVLNETRQFLLAGKLDSIPLILGQP